LSDTQTPEIARRRILWLSHFLPWPPMGGLMQRSYYLMREVARHHDVEVVAFRQQAHQADDAALAEAEAALSEFAHVAHVSDLPENRMSGGRATLALRSLLPGPPYTIRWGMCADYARAVKRALEEFQPDVIHFDTVSLAPYLDLAGQVPAVLNHHNIESHMLLRRARNESNIAKRFYFWQEGRRLARYEQNVGPSFKAHLVCSEMDADRLKDLVGSVPVTVVPNGVDVDYFSNPTLPSGERPNTLIFVGDMTWYPNISAIRFFLESVWPLISAARPEATFSLVGRSPPPDIVAYGQRDQRIRVLGFVDDMRPLVAESMVYICPIHDGGGTKLKMLDAMSMKKAIVAHPVAAEGLGLTHGHDVLLSDDPKGLADHCIRLFDSDELRTRLAGAARARVEQVFSWRLIGRQLAETYSCF
jgi:glycosyltransferase involved in cell wall biosynthesis